MPIYDYLDSFAFIIIVKFEFPFKLQMIIIFQVERFRVQRSGLKKRTQLISKWILYSLQLGICFTQWVIPDVPDFDQYGEQGPSVVGNVWSSEPQSVECRRLIPHCSAFILNYQNTFFDVRRSSVSFSIKLAVFWASGSAHTRMNA